MSDHSPQLDKLTAALVRVQTELAAVQTDATAWVGRPGASDSYRYATLNSVWEASRRALSANGFAISQTCEPGQAGELQLTTWLLHTSGQWLCGTESLPVTWRSPRGYGSALTYARRYGLAAIVGVCVEHDDDAAAAIEPASYRGSPLGLGGFLEQAPLEDEPAIADKTARKQHLYAQAARAQHRVTPPHSRNGSQPPE